MSWSIGACSVRWKHDKALNKDQQMRLFFLEMNWDCMGSQCQTSKKGGECERKHVPDYL